MRRPSNWAAAGRPWYSPPGPRSRCATWPGRCEAAGGRALVVPTDVADRAQVDRLAQTAVAKFGRIDTWINDAAVSQYATVEDSTIEEIEQIIQTDLLGVIYGCKAALPVMKRQGEGTIVNVSSVLGKLSVPLQAAYCASKHGIIGFADSPAAGVEAGREQRSRW